MAQGKDNKKALNAAEASSKTLTSRTNTQKPLNPKPKITKKAPNQNPAKTNDAKGKNKKKALNGAEASSKTLTSGTNTQKKPLKPKPKIAKKTPCQILAETNEVKGTSQLQVKTVYEKKGTVEANKVYSIANIKRDKEKPKRDEAKPNSQVENKEKGIANEKSQSDEKDEGQLGGLIFMCNRKTKPDCFRYSVMGISLGKQYLVMGIKPGLKLFLYDFDLKLMYGIYEASSSGGMRLEPTAFGGDFPVQVRFKVHKDCLPLPESVFRIAIKDNYNENQKFRIELTVQQVKNLIELFQPIQVQSHAHSIGPPLIPTVPSGEIFEGRREPYSREAGTSRMQSDHKKEQLPRQPLPAYRGIPPTHNEAVPHGPLYLNEKEYRTYGLGQEQQASTPATAPTAPTLAIYQREQHLRHPAPIHREAGFSRVAVHREPLFLSEKEYRAYGLTQEVPTSAPPAASNPYYPHHYGAASSGTNHMPPVREATSSDVGRLYSTYASNALSDYNQRQHGWGNGPEPASTPVSSRYSFGGPSSSYR